MLVCRSRLVLAASAVVVLAFCSPSTFSAAFLAPVPKVGSQLGHSLHSGADSPEVEPASTIWAAGGLAVAAGAMAWASSMRAFGAVRRSGCQSMRRGGLVSASAASWPAAQVASHRLKPSGLSAQPALSFAIQRRALADVAEVAEKIDELVKEHPVLLFTKSTCPFCAEAKDILDEERIAYHDVDLTEFSEKDMENYQYQLMEITGARTVPRVFIGGKCIGGCSDLVDLKESGKLAQIIPADSISKADPAADFKLQKSEDEWRKELTDVEYYILRQQGTEPPGSHEYDKFLPTKGHFACRACNLPLYSADSKFKSSCGWPVFDKCYYSEEAGGAHVGTKPDMGAAEIICNRCGSHLGHVFFDAFSERNPNGERH